MISMEFMAQYLVANPTRRPDTTKFPRSLKPRFTAKIDSRTFVLYLLRDAIHAPRTIMTKRKNHERMQRDYFYNAARLTEVHFSHSFRHAIDLFNVLSRRFRCQR